MDIEWPKLDWTEEEKEQHEGVEMRCHVLRFQDEVFEKSAIGVDPGRNFGVALVRPDRIRVWNGYLHQDEDSWAEDGWTAFKLMQAMFDYYKDILDCGVEGAAHSTRRWKGKTVRQAQLAYIREGFFLGLTASGHLPEIVPIPSARKSASGHGHLSFADCVPSLNENAADAIGVALHVAGYRATEKCLEL